MLSLDFLMALYLLSGQGNFLLLRPLKDGGVKTFFYRKGKHRTNWIDFNPHSADSLSLYNRVVSWYPEFELSPLSGKTAEIRASSSRTTQKARESFAIKLTACTTTNEEVSCRSVFVCCSKTDQKPKPKQLQWPITTTHAMSQSAEHEAITRNWR